MILVSYYSKVIRLEDTSHIDHILITYSSTGNVVVALLIDARELVIDM